MSKELKDRDNHSKTCVEDTVRGLTWTKETQPAKETPSQNVLYTFNRIGLGMYSTVLVSF